MVEIGNVLVSFDVLTKHFLCDLKACKGACCIEGDAGAPVTMEEVAALEEALPEIWDELDLQARKVINKQGVAYVDVQGDLVTSIVNGKDCVFTCYEDGCCYCAVEKAFRAGRIKSNKPASCHLYPIRIKKQSNGYYTLNFDKWQICQPAEVLGKEKGVPVYKFLQQPLTNYFGKEWYNELELVVSEMKKQGYL